MLKIKFIVLLFCGFLSLAVGGVGIFLPVLPTTPFVLISAACFASSSPRIYNRLLRAKYFGEFVDNYKNKVGVTKAVKVRGIAFLWVMLTVSALLFQSAAVRIVLLIVGIAVTLHIVLLKNKK